jgi:cytidylate kinase
MKIKSLSTLQLVEKQATKWRMQNYDQEIKVPKIPVITISRESGCGGGIVADKIAAKLGLDLFHQEVVHQIAKSAHVSTFLVESLDERGLSMVEDWITAMINERHLWPDEYSQILMKVIGTIGRHGHAVLVGRGANFILPRDNRFRVRLVADQTFRIHQVASAKKVSLDEAKRKVVQTDADRKSFIRKYFNADINNPCNYDLVIDIHTLGIDKTADLVCSVFK